MIYFDMRYQTEAFAMMHTVCKNFHGYTKNQGEKAILYCKVQAMIGHLTEEKFKKW